MDNTLWTVQFGKLSSGEWVADVTFASVSNSDWNAIHSLAEQYTTISFQGCPVLTIADDDHRLRFRLGNVKPQNITNLSADEGEILQTYLVKCGEALSKIGLGLWCLDRQLVWKVDDTFLIVPVFWLPVLCGKTALPPDIAPEQMVKTAVELDFSTSSEIYAIASLCYWALTNQNYNRNRPLLPSAVNPNLQIWDDSLMSAMHKEPSQRPSSFQDWTRRTKRKSLETLLPPVLDNEPQGPPLPSNQPQRQPPKKADDPKITWDVDNWEGHTMDENDENNGKPLIPHLNFPIHPDKRWVVIVIAILIALYLLHGCVSMVVRNIPIIGASYQRGTGADVVHYANRSYDKAKWSMVEVEGLNNMWFRPNHIRGWDKNNLAVVGGKYVITMKNGEWSIMQDQTLIDRYVYCPRYTSANEFLVPYISYFSGNKSHIRLFRPSNYTDIYWDYSPPSYRQQSTTHQMERDAIVIESSDNNAKLPRFCELRDSKISPISSTDKRFSILGDNRNELLLVHSYKNGKAVGFLGKFFKYENGQWSKHFDDAPGDVRAIWSIDANNFVAVGGEGITMYRNGNRTHPIVNISGVTYQGPWLCVWGVDLNKYWVMDEHGFVVQIEGDRIRSVVQATPQMANVTFTDAWVSPEGTVFAIERNGIYRLE